MKLTMWLKERELNSRRLAAGKTGEDRAGWLEDADHLQAALAAVEECDRLRAALQEADNIMGHEDGHTAWRERWQTLWPWSGGPDGPVVLAPTAREKRR